MTKLEIAYRARVAALGCCVCRMLNYGATPAEIHHERSYTGAARKADESRIMPLCDVHHRHGDGSRRYNGELAYHCAPRTWEARYGTQASFVELTQREARCDLLVELAA